MVFELAGNFSYGPGALRSARVVAFGGAVVSEIDDKTRDRFLPRAWLEHVGAVGAHASCSGDLAKRDVLPKAGRAGDSLRCRIVRSVSGGDCAYDHICANVNRMAIRFIIRHEASVTRPSWRGRRLCLHWGVLTDVNGRAAEEGYRNMWRNEKGRLLTGRAQARIPSKAVSDELWSIAEAEGWADLLGDGAED